MGRAAALQAALADFLSSQVGERVTVRDVEPISSVGNAREPWAFTATWSRRDVRAVLLLKAAAGQLDAELGPEFRTLERLGGSGVPVPRALWLDEDGTAIGRPFFATERVPGTADVRGLTAVFTTLDRRPAGSRSGRRSPGRPGR